jgi:hypothetical protein
MSRTVGLVDGKKASNDTFAPVLLPWVRTEGAVLPKLHPLAAQRAEHTVRLDLCKQWVRAQLRRALLRVPPA